VSQRGLRVEFRVPSRRKPKESPPTPVKDPVPRIARLLALAWKWELAVRRGEVKDYAEIARRMELSRARVTQVCGLTLLAPEIQEAVLLSYGNQDIPKRSLRSVRSHADWSRQRESLRLTSPTARG